MAKKQKRTPKASAQNSTKELFQPFHTNALPLAILTALIDPQAVKVAKLANTFPEEPFATAEYLLWSIDYRLKNPASRESPEEREEAKTVFFAHILKEWPLSTGGKPFLLEDAVKQPWCRYKTVPNLRKFLERNDYPFHFFKLAGFQQPFITEGVFEKALAKNRERERQNDRARKKRPKNKLQRKNAGGNLVSTNGTKPPTSGKIGPTSGKSERTPGQQPK
jgi:hypothetical protein